MVALWATSSKKLGGQILGAVVGEEHDDVAPAETPGLLDGPPEGAPRADAGKDAFLGGQFPGQPECRGILADHPLVHRRGVPDFGPPLDADVADPLLLVLGRRL